MGALTTAYVLVAPDMRTFGKDLKLGLRRVDVSSSGRDAGTRFSSGMQGSTKKAMGRGLAAVGVAAGAAFAGALTRGFGRLSAIENAEAKLTGLGHSAKTVDKIMVNALASVKGTAFGLDEASTLAATAVASGIKPGRELERTLKLVADAATIGGTSLGDMGAIFSQVAASNKVQGDTINQLNERGIPILKLLADVTGKSQGEVSALASKGKIDFATFQKAMEKGLGGAALKSGNTATGAFKNMGAAFSRVGAALMKGVFPQMAGGFGMVTGWLDKITPAAARFGDAVGDALSKAGAGLTAFRNAFKTGKTEDEGTWLERIGLAARDASRFIRTAAIPALQALFDALFKNQETDTGNWFFGVVTTAIKIRLALGTVKASFEALYDALFKGQETDTGNWFMGVVVGAVQVRQALMQVADFVRANVLPALKSLGTFVLTTLLPAWLSWYSFLFKQLTPILKQVGGFVVTSVIPALRAVARFIATDVVPGFLSIVETVKGLIRVVVPIIAQVVGAIVGRFTEMRPQIMSIWGSIKEIVVGAMGIIRGVISVATRVIKFIWDKWGSDILALVKTVFGAIVGVIGPVFKIIAGIFKTFAAVLNGDWSAAWGGLKQILQGNLDLIYALLKGAVAIIGGLLKLIWTPIVKSARDAWASAIQTVKDAWARIAGSLKSGAATVAAPVRNAWNSIRDATVKVWATITDGIRSVFRRWVTIFKIGVTAAIVPVVLAWEGLKAVTKAVFGFIMSRIISPIWERIRGVFTTVSGVVRRIWSAFWDALKRGALIVWTAVWRNVISPIWQRIRAVFTTVMGVIRGLFSAWWNNLRNNATAIFNAIRTLISTVWGRIRGVFTGAQTSVRTSWSGFWTGVKNSARSAMDWVHTKISGVLNKIKSAFSTAKANIKKTWDGVKGVVSAPITWVKDNVYNKPLVPVWNAVAKLVDGPKLSAYARGGIAEAERYANGGTPFGVRPGYTPGRDTHSILVGGGEAIMRPEWTRAVGADYVNAANAAARRGSAKGFIGGEPGFAGGGIVGWIKDKLGSAGAAISGLAGKIKGFVLGGLRSAAGALLNPLKGVIDRNMPKSGVGETVGGIGKKAIDLLLEKISSADAAASAAGGMSWGGGSFRGLSNSQMNIAATIASVGRAMGKKAQLIGIITGLVESRLANVNYGDRDSLGVFQQRAPWGPASVRRNVGASAGMFFHGGRGGQPGLDDIRGWQSMLPGTAAQRVQVSAFPGRYQQQVTLGNAILGALASTTGGPATGSQRRVQWKGKTFTERFRNTLLQAQRFAGRDIPVIQGGFTSRVSASGTSHHGDAIDTISNTGILSALRRARVAAWKRTPAQGFSHHIHGVPLPGAGFPGGSGIWQAQDYLRGGNGLALGGIVSGGRGGVLTRIGEGANDELVQPLPRNWRAGRSDDKLDRLIAAIEAHGLNGPSFSFGDIINPREEALSQTTNRILQRTASLPLV